MSDPHPPGYLPIMPHMSRDNAGRSRDKVRTSRDNEGTIRGKQGQARPGRGKLGQERFSVPDCPLLALIVPDYPCWLFWLFLHIPTRPLLIPACLSAFPRLYPGPLIRMKKKNYKLAPFSFTRHCCPIHGQKKTFPVLIFFFSPWSLKSCVG